MQTIYPQFNTVMPGGSIIQAVQVVPTTAILAANARIDGTAANAFVWLNGVDLSAYQTGNYILWLSDGTNAAWGYISATAPTGDGSGGAAYTDMITGDNSTFTSDTGWWTKGTGWTISGGYANADGTGTDADCKRLALNTVGGLYLSSFDVIRNSGQVRWQYGGTANSGILRNASGTFTEYRTQSISGNIYINSQVLNGTVDNVLMRHVDDPPPTGALILQSKDGPRGWSNGVAGAFPTALNPNGVNRYTVYKVQ
jgi:hypothetical protein